MPSRSARAASPVAKAIVSAIVILAAVFTFAGCAREVFVPTRPPEIRLKPHEDIVLDGSGSFDPEGEKLTYRWRQVAGPEVKLRDADTPWPRFTPTGPGRYEFELVVAAPPEGGRGFLLEGPPVRLTVDVLPPNRRPRVEVAAILSAEPGQWAFLDGGDATDPDGDVLTFHWELVTDKDKGPAAPLPMLVEMDPFNGRGRRVRVRAWRSGECRFRLTVTDAFGATATDETVLRVAPNDLPPVGIPRVQGGASFSNEEGALASGHFALRLGAWPHPNGGVNEPPVAVARADGPDGDGRVVLDGSASRDPNGDTLEFRWEQTAGPKVRVMRPLDSPENNDVHVDARDLARVEFTPPALGRYAFSLVVFDGVLESKAVTVEVVASDEVLVIGEATTRSAPPSLTRRLPSPSVLTTNSVTADAGRNATVETGVEVALDGRGSRGPRGVELIHDWRQIAGPRVRAFRLDPVEGGSRPRFTPEVAGQYEFELRVSHDRIYWSVPDRVRVMVLGANRPPWVEAPSLVRARAGEVVRVAASWGDPDGDLTSVNWRVIGKPGSRLPQKRGVAEFTAPEGNCTLEATVRDSRGAMARTRVRVIVPGEGRAPVAIVRVAGDVRPGGRVLLDGSDSYDLEGKPLEFRWSLAGTTLIRLAGHKRPVASFRAPAAGIYDFTLVVSAPGRESSPVRLAVDVPESAPPKAEGIVVAPIPARVTAGRTVVLDASATLSSSGRPRITWTQVAGPAYLMAGARLESSRLVVKATEVGSYRFRVEADAPGIASREVGFKVVTANAPPLASALATPGPGGRVVLDGSRSRDPEGAPLLYRWTEVEGRSLGLDGRAAGSPRLVVEDVLPGRHSVRLAVTDGERVTRSGVIEFEVAEAPSEQERRP
jgi:hypothetical protein